MRRAIGQSTSWCAICGSVYPLCAAAVDVDDTTHNHGGIHDTTRTAQRATIMLKVSPLHGLSTVNIRIESSRRLVGIPFALADDAGTIGGVGGR